MEKKRLCSEGWLLKTNTERLTNVRNRNRKVELTIRLNLWFRNAFEELVTRVEIQNGINNTGRSITNNSKSKGKRAKHLVKEGARARAVISLTSELANLTPEEEEAYADELLPQSVRPSEALSGGIGVDEIDEPNAESEFGYGLKGVRFKALSAPGPSGARPEHLKELLACGNKRVAREFARNIGKFVVAASEGHLPDEARFILDSRLVYLRKKHGNVPRPIRVGELWRRVIAKRLMFDNQSDVASVCKKARQFGVGLPGGADVLIHTRLVLERLCREGKVDNVMAMLDIDFKNAFPSIEWDSIREAVDILLPKLSIWCAWCHEAPMNMQLHSGSSELPQVSCQ